MTFPFSASILGAARALLKARAVLIDNRQQLILPSFLPSSSSSSSLFLFPCLAPVQQHCRHAAAVLALSSSFHRLATFTFISRLFFCFSKFQTSPNAPLISRCDNCNQVRPLQKSYIQLKTKILFTYLLFFK